MERFHYWPRHLLGASLFGVGLLFAWQCLILCGALASSDLHSFDLQLGCKVCYGWTSIELQPVDEAHC